MSVQVWLDHALISRTVWCLTTPLLIRCLVPNRLEQPRNALGHIQKTCSPFLNCQICARSPPLCLWNVFSAQDFVRMSAPNHSTSHQRNVPHIHYTPLVSCNKRCSNYARARFQHSFHISGMHLFQHVLVRLYWPMSLFSSPPSGRSPHVLRPTSAECTKCLHHCSWWQMAFAFWPSRLLIGMFFYRRPLC